jgi:hypothetical protein
VRVVVLFWLKNGFVMLSTILVLAFILALGYWIYLPFPWLDRPAIEKGLSAKGGKLEKMQWQSKASQDGLSLGKTYHINYLDREGEHRQTWAIIGMNGQVMFADDWSRPQKREAEK